MAAGSVQTEKIRDSLMGLISMSPAGSIFENAETEEFRRDTFCLRLGEGEPIYSVEVRYGGSLTSAARS